MCFCSSRRCSCTSGVRVWLVFRDFVIVKEHLVAAVSELSKYLLMAWLLSAFVGGNPRWLKKAITPPLPNSSKHLIESRVVPLERNGGGGAFLGLGGIALSNCLS